MSATAQDCSQVSSTGLVEVLSSVARELARRDAPASPAVCMEEVEALGRATDLLEVAIATRVGVADRSGQPQQWGHSSTAAWLRAGLGMRGGRAVERRTMAAQLPRLPETTRRVRAGDLPHDFAAVIASAVAKLSDEECGKAEEILLSLVDAGCTVSELTGVAQRIKDVIAERDGQEQPPEDARRGRRSWLRLSSSTGGGAFTRGWFNAELKALINARLGPLATPTGADDPRDHAERMADALATYLSKGDGGFDPILIINLGSQAGSSSSRPTTGPTTGPTAGDPGDSQADGDPGPRADGGPGPRAEGTDGPDRPRPSSGATESPAGSTGARTEGSAAAPDPQLFGYSDPQLVDQADPQPADRSDPRPAGSDGPRSGGPGDLQAARSGPLFGGRSDPRSAGSEGPRPGGSGDVQPARHSGPQLGGSDGSRSGGRSGPRPAGFDGPRSRGPEGSRRGGAADLRPGGPGGRSADPRSGKRTGATESGAVPDRTGDDGAEGRRFTGTRDRTAGDTDACVESGPAPIGLFDDRRLRARLADGTPISPQRARQILLTAGFSTLFLGSDGHPLYFGRRTRFASPHQRRVLNARYRTCVVDGCDIPAVLCEIDHVEGWCPDGTTDIDRLVPCCSFHNRWKAEHPGRIHITVNGDGLYRYRIIRHGDPPSGGSVR